MSHGWYPISVKKTSLYLDPELDRAVARLAEARGVSKAEVVRRSLESAVAGLPRVRISAIGVGEGPGDVADGVDRHLRDSGFGRS